MKDSIECPLMGGIITSEVCFDIHMVVDCDAPDITAPQEIFEVQDFRTVCTQCPNHRND